MERIRQQSLFFLFFFFLSFSYSQNTHTHKLKNFTLGIFSFYSYSPRAIVPSRSFTSSLSSSCIKEGVARARKQTGVVYSNAPVVSYKGVHIHTHIDTYTVQSTPPRGRGEKQKEVDKPPSLYPYLHLSSFLFHFTSPPHGMLIHNALILTNISLFLCAHPRLDEK